MTKRITSVFLCVLIVFTIVITDYKKVSAFEWAIPTITFDVALPFLMGLLGVTYATSDSILVPTEDEFFSYAEEQNIAGPDVRVWLDNVFAGTLNQASNVWSCFKSWVNSLVNGSSSEIPIIEGDLKSIINLGCPNVSSITYYTSTVEEFANTYSYVKGYYYVSSSGSYSLHLFDSNYVFSYDANIFTFEHNLSSTYYHLTTINTNVNSTVGTINRSASKVTTATYISTSTNELVDGDFYVFGVNSIPTSSNVHLLTNITIPDITSDFFDSLTDNITNLDLLGSDAISTSIPDVITLPWQNVGDTTQEISDSIDSLIEAVNEGVLDLSDLVTTIQDLLDVITIDTTTDIVIPETVDPDTSEPTTSDDVVNENISNTAFVLSGLEKLFPFCIPFDLYKFATLLVAEPQAPVLNYPIYNPANKETYNISIDFEEWEEIVILGRYIFDFLFIIGLILITYKLIGG